LALLPPRSGRLVQPQVGGSRSDRSDMVRLSRPRFLHPEVSQQGTLLSSFLDFGNHSALERGWLSPNRCELQIASIECSSIECSSPAYPSFLVQCYSRPL